MADPKALVVAAERVFTIRKGLALGGKIAITCACFWYVFRQVKIAELLQEAGNLEMGWVALATIFAAAQVPLVGVRWALITNALEPESAPVPLRAVLSINMIGTFFAQILPNVMSDALRIWLLSKIRGGWQKGLASVAIDRGVGVGILLTLGLVTLASGSAFTALAGYRKAAFVTVAALLMGGIGGLVSAPIYAPLLTRNRFTTWMGEFALASRQVLIQSPAAISIVAIAFVVHFLSIADIWCLGRAFSMPLSVVDAAVLFTLILAIALIPVTV